MRLLLLPPFTRACLAAQLRACACGERRDDPHGMMRTIACAMTGEALEASAAWYASRRVPRSATHQ